ncbi:UDP-N-acetylmuramate dehydrogenase [Kibdelosporangium aridum]|uniref:UDP-N-acetylmuramate dehydrogenase n=1 Tax=Kibdelosporangium aridum TaxID=2030 RepID=UPI0026815C0B
MTPVTTSRPGTDVRTAVPLCGYTTLRLGGPATRFIEAKTARAVVDAVRAADEAGEPLLVLGGGSNVLVSDHGFDGTVVHVATKGMTEDCTTPGLVQLTAEAGENWDDVVAKTVSAGLGGLECLSGIPGLVGATPVQNVGAYGVEISEVLVSVDLLDRASGEVRTLTADQLRLAYRTSVLKGTDRAVVLRVRFELADTGLSMPIRYAELANTLGVAPGERVPVDRVRQSVLDLRRGKGMVLDEDDHDTWSAGSFFTNPVLPHDELQEALARIAAQVGTDVRIPQYPADGGGKLSAAWLIERAGFAKGYPGPGNRVSLSHSHTLALTNRGDGTTADLLSLAREVRDGVHKVFGVQLEAEPVLVGVTL